MGHHPPHGFGQAMDRREERVDDDEDERDVQEAQDRSDRRRHRGSRDRSHCFFPVFSEQVLKSYLP